VDFLGVIAIYAACSFAEWEPIPPLITG